MPAEQLQQRSAPVYRAGGVLLAGSAAHATNPCGGLGRYADTRRPEFVETARPRATASQHLLFHSADPAELAGELDLFRLMSGDPGLAADVLSFTETVESPPLLQV